MPIYQVEAPDGKIISVEGPENAPQDQIVNFAISSYLSQQRPAPEAPAPAAAPEEGDFMRGVKSYFPSIQETFGGAQALAGKAIGSEGIMQAGIERMKKAQAEQKPKETDEFTNAWDKGIGTVLTDWLPYQIGSGVGNIAESIAMAGAGSLLGGTLGAGVGAAPGAAAGFLSKSLVKKGIKEAAKEIMEKQGKEAAEDYIARNAIGEIEAEAAKTLARQGGKMYGTTAGIAGQALLHGAGETTSRALQEAGYDPEQLDMSKLVPAIGVHSVADFVSEKILLGGFKGMAGIPEKSTNKFVFDVLKGAAATGAKEIPPEVVQSVAERFGAKMDVGDADAVSEYMNTAAAAFAMSVLPGGVGGARTYMGRPQGMPQPTTEFTPPAEPQVGQPPIEGTPPAPEAAREAADIREMEQGMPGMQVPEQAVSQPAPAAVPEQAIAPERPAQTEPISQPEPEQKPQGFQFDPAPLVEKHSIDGVPAMTPGLAKDIGAYVTQQIADGNTVLATDPSGSPVRIEGFENGLLIGENGMKLSPFWFTNVDGNGNTLQIIPQEQAKEAPKEAAVEYAPEQQAALDLISAIDQGGVPLNPAKIRTIAEGLGLDVQKSASPQDTIQRIREAAQRFQPIAQEAAVETHPLESWAVNDYPNAKEARRAALESAEKAGVDIVYKGLNINPDESKIDWNKLEKQKTAGAILRNIRDHVPLDFKEVIDRILPAVKDMPVSVNRRVTKSFGGVHKANWVTGDQSIEYARKVSYGNTISTVVHEIVHGATVVNYLRGKHGVDPRYTAAAREMDKLAMLVRQLAPAKELSFLHDPKYYPKDTWGRELIARALTERSVQETLKKIKLNETQTAWSKFVEVMCKLLNIPKSEVNAMSKLLEISEKFMEPVEKHAGRGKPVTTQRKVNPLENENFRKWFGSSKVVDEDGNPLVVYHGTNAEIEKFGQDEDVLLYKNLGLPNNGVFYFAKDPSTSETYAEGEGANIVPVYLSIKNPLIVDAHGKKYNHGLSDRLGGSSGITLDAVYDALDNGHDGVIVKNVIDDVSAQGKPTDVYIAFNRNQIKSVFNEGTYSPESDVISKSVQPEEDEKKMKTYPRQNIMGRPVSIPEDNAYSIGEEEPSRWSKFVNDHIYDYVDKFVDLKKLIAAINATKHKLDDKWDAYMRETLYHQRVRFQTKEFLEKELEPMAREMVARGVSEEELNAYLMARHAEEYNKVINQRNPDNTDLQDRGSGILTMVADAYLKGATQQQIDALRSSMQLNKNEEALLAEIPKMTPAKRKALEEIAKSADAIIRKTQKIVIDGGVEKKATIDYWNDMYKHYVPLKRSPEELEFEQHYTGAGKGFSTKAGIGRAATGSLKTIDNVFSNIINQRDMAIVKAEKARIGRALYAMALQHPNPSFWLPVNPNAGIIAKANDLFIKIQKDKAKLEGLGKTIDNLRDSGQDADVQLEAYQTLRDKIYEDEKRHTAMQAEANKVKQEIINEMKKFGYDSQGQNLDAETIENIIREPQGSFYNPNTGLVEYRTNSFLRSSPNVLAVPIDGETRYIFFNQGNPVAKRLAASLKGADVEQLGRLTSLVSKFTRFIASVNTQYNPFFGIVNMMRDIQGAQFNLSSTPLAGQQMAVNKNIMGAASTIWQSVRDGNPKGPFAAQWEEFQKRGGTTGIREMLNDNQKKVSALSSLIAEYHRNPTQAALLKAGRGAIQFMSDFNDTMENAVRLAAFIEAKNKFSKIYANPDVAADKAAELAKNLTVNFNRKGAKTSFVNSLYAFFNASVQGTARLAETLKGPGGKKIMTALVMLGVIQQLMLEGFDDDDPPEFVRQKNLVIPTGGGKYISIPMPLGFNVFVNAGRLATSTVTGGGDNIAKNVGKFATAIGDSFNPLGGGSLVQTAAPTILDPAVALYGNTDAFGRPIFRADRPGQPVPGYLRSTEGATDISRFIAKALNAMSGGTEFQKGEISPTADQIDYLAGQIGGGTFREARKLAEFGSNQVTGEETAPYRIPLAGRFMGDTGSEANVRNKFYQNVQQMASYEAEIKGRMPKGTAAEFLKEHPEARMYQAANAAESQITKINKLRKQLIERGASKEQLKQLNDMKIQYMRQFNEAYDRATK